MPSKEAQTALPKDIKDQLAAYASSLRGSRSSVPVMLRPICDALKIQVKRRPDVQNGKAYLAWDRSRHPAPTILLPMKPHKTWDRFCSAHELGHYFLLTKYDWMPSDGKAYWETEELCDFFARELLLPNERRNSGQFRTNARACLAECDATAAQAIMPWKQTATAISEATSAFFLVLDKSEKGGLTVASSSLPNRTGTGVELASELDCVQWLRNLREDARRSHADVQEEIAIKLFKGTKLGSILSDKKVRHVIARASPFSARFKLAGLRHASELSSDATLAA